MIASTDLLCVTLLTVVCIIVCQSGSATGKEIHVTVIDDKTGVGYKVRLDDFDYVRDLKAKYQNGRQKKWEAIHLYTDLTGSELNDNKRLADYGLKHNSFVTDHQTGDYYVKTTKPKTRPGSPNKRY